MEDEFFFQTIISERPTGKLPSTGVTNELARAVNGIMPNLRHGQSDEPFVFPLPMATMLQPLDFEGLGGGFYECNVLVQPDAGVATTSTDTSELGSDPGDSTPTAILVVPSEVGTGNPGTHNLDLTKPIGGILYPRKAKDGRDVYIMLGEVGGSTLPKPTARYQVLQCTSFTSSTVYTLGFDWVRAH